MSITIESLKYTISFHMIALKSFDIHSFYFIYNFCFQELKDITSDPPAGCSAGPETEGDRKYMNFLHVPLDIFTLNLEKKDTYFPILM